MRVCCDSKKHWADCRTTFSWSCRL